MRVSYQRIYRLSNVHVVRKDLSSRAYYAHGNFAPNLTVDMTLLRL